MESRDMADVGCAGILVADTFCGPMKALPDEGKLLAIDSMPTKPGGCAANVAIDLAKQGFSVDVSGCLGKDPSSKILQSFFDQYGIGTEGLVYTDDFPTSQTTILLVEGEDRRFIHVFGANGAYRVSDISRDWVKGLKVFYLGGLFLMPAFKCDEFLDLLKFCRDQGVTTVVDVVIPEGHDVMDELRLILPYVDYFLPNDDEAAALTGESDPKDQLRVFLEAGAKNVFITCGKAGTVAGSGETFWKSDIYRMDKIVDQTGAGDAFDAGVIAGILEGQDLTQAMKYGSALGASATQAIGTVDGVFTKAQAMEFIAANELKISSGSLK